MKRVKIVLGLLAAAVLAALTGMGLFKHFVTDQIMDKGGMMNPDYRNETTSFYHETSEEDTGGRLIMEIDLADSSRTVGFRKQKY